MSLRVGSLFSGIGGLDLGLERAGMTVAWQAEVDPFASSVLAHHWPNVPNLGDVTSIDWSTVERPDLICGGYPCQPFSTAGKRAGADDPRHLWPYVRDALRVLRPRYALLENVSGHVSLGLADVLYDLAEIRFAAEWTVVPASWVGAPHRRDRLFVLAYAEELLGDGGPHHVGGFGEGSLTGPYLPEPRDSGSASRPDCGWWASEPNVGRVAHGLPARVDRLRALGNAVVPQVAELIGRRIIEAAA